MYLIFSDFKRSIQSDNLLQIIGQDLTVLERAKNIAQEEATSYLIQHFDVENEFTDTSQYDNTKVYKAANRVYLDAVAYDATKPFSVGALTLQASNVYRCKTAILSPGEVFNAAHWDLLGAQYSTFYVDYPKSIFTLNGIYKLGDQVFWKDKVYTATKATQGVDWVARIQNNDATFPNIINAFPDESVEYWGIGAAYTLGAGLLPTSASWINGDNRSQQMVSCLIDIALYHLHKRIAPRNIPELRVKAYDDAIAWLKKAMKGDVTPKLMEKQPEQGKRVRWSSVQKQNNGY
jgi:hypothetical protein